MLLTSPVDLRPCHVEWLEGDDRSTGLNSRIGSSPADRSSVTLRVNIDFLREKPRSLARGDKGDLTGGLLGGAGFPDFGERGLSGDIWPSMGLGGEKVALRVSSERLGVAEDFLACHLGLATDVGDRPGVVVANVSWSEATAFRSFSVVDEPPSSSLPATSTTSSLIVAEYSTAGSSPSGLGPFFSAMVEHAFSFQS